MSVFTEEALVERAWGQLTPERWERAKAVLEGEDEQGVSNLAAAKAAGVKLRTLKRWVARSRERRLGDPTWTYEIAEVFDDAKELQGAVLEDKLWAHATQGVDEPVFQGGEIVGHKRKWDHKLMQGMLQVRDENYRPKPASPVGIVVMDAQEVLQRLRAGRRMKQIGEGSE